MLKRFQDRSEDRPADMFLTKQVHKDRAIRVLSKDSVADIAAQEADALWTTELGVCVGVKTADCAPVLVWDSANRFVAAIHAGWRGAALGIVPKTLRLIAEELGLELSDCEAAIGPCIGAAVYEVGPEVTAQVPAEFIKPGQGDRAYLDLRSFVASQLSTLGISKIEISSHCTNSEPENFYSARRGDTGRQYSWVSRKSKGQF